MKKYNINYAQRLFQEAQEKGEVSKYKKFRKIKARPAKKGTVIKTIINGKKETQATAKENDVLIKALGDNVHYYFISKDKLEDRYIETNDKIDKDGFKTYIPTGEAYAFKYKGDSFQFMAPWGEYMLVNDGDYIASTSITDFSDIYRIEKQEFIDSYKKVKNDLS